MCFERAGSSVTVDLFLLLWATHTLCIAPSSSLPAPSPLPLPKLYEYMCVPRGSDLTARIARVTRIRFMAYLREFVLSYTCSNTCLATNNKGTCNDLVLYDDLLWKTSSPTSSGRRTAHGCPQTFIVSNIRGCVPLRYQYQD